MWWGGELVLCLALPWLTVLFPGKDGRAGEGRCREFCQPHTLLTAELHIIVHFEVRTQCWVVLGFSPFFQVSMYVVGKEHKQGVAEKGSFLSRAPGRTKSWGF
jgi:hypothetical protein